MAHDRDKDITPQEGFARIQDLIVETFADGDADLEALSGMLGELGEVVAATGVQIDGMDQQINDLHDQTEALQTHFANTDAAMWVGDLERARHLGENMPGPSLQSVIADMSFDMADFDDFDEDDEDEDGEMIDDDIADLMAQFDDIEGAPDPYEDILSGLPGAIDAFIATGTDPNTPAGPYGHNALHAALDAPGRSAQGIAKLIAAGCDPAAIHDFGDNTISWAMGYNHPETVARQSEEELIALLVSHGADPSHVTPGQWNTMHRAIIQGGENQVAALIAQGVSIDDTVFIDFEPEKLAGLTPLMLAAPKPKVFKLLLDSGADPMKADLKGRKPIDFVAGEAAAARARATPEDHWTMDHAKALGTSLQILSARLSH